MKLSWLFLGLAMIAGVAVAGATIVGCGPENKFCLPNGPCPRPIVDAGGEAPVDTGSDRRIDRGRN